MSRCVRVIIAASIACGLALAVPTGVAAKGQKGKKAASSSSRSFTGCVEKGDEPNTFKITNITGKGAPKTAEVVETASGVNLAPHVGHKVTVTGTRLSTAAAAKAEGAKNSKEERGEYHMRADGMTMVSTTCP